MLYDNIFEKGVIPIITCPTQISEHSASQVLTTDIFNNFLKKGIIKSVFLIIYQYFSQYN